MDLKNARRDRVSFAKYNEHKGFFRRLKHEIANVREDGRILVQSTKKAWQNEKIARKVVKKKYNEATVPEQQRLNEIKQKTGEMIRTDRGAKTKEFRDNKEVRRTDNGAGGFSQRFKDEVATC